MRAYGEWDRLAERTQDCTHRVLHDDCLNTSCICIDAAFRFVFDCGGDTKSSSFCGAWLYLIPTENGRGFTEGLDAWALFVFKHL